MQNKQRSSPSAKLQCQSHTTNWRGNTSGLIIATVVFCGGAAFAQQEVSFVPRFRHVDPGSTVVVAKPAGILTLLTDEDFAPWSFRAADGSFKGISVELALAACSEAQIQCQIKAMAHEKLVVSLQAGEGDLIISGLKINQAIADQAALTRPYFVSLGRFMARQGSPLTGPDVRALAGKRLGFVKGSAHGAFIEKYYSRSSLTGFADTAAMYEALRTGIVDAIFGDSIAQAYWSGGSLSRACCASLGKAFVDRETFSRNLVFLAKRDDRQLRDVFDASLDQLEEKNLTAKIFNEYLPGPIW